MKYIAIKTKTYFIHGFGQFKFIEGQEVPAKVAALSQDLKGVVYEAIQEQAQSQTKIEVKPEIQETKTQSKPFQKSNKKRKK